MKPNFRSAAVWMPLALAVAFIIGMFVGHRSGAPLATSPVQQKVSDIMTLINSEYVDQVDPDSILELSIPDILAKLDPHTTYIPASELESTNQVLEGSFGGIGVVFNMLTDTATVVEVVSGGPAEKVGMLAGDRIVTVDDSIIAGKKIDSEAIRSRLKGPKGTSVKLGVKRATASDLLTFEVTRGDIPVTSIDASYMVAPGTGYVRVNKFGRSTYSEFLNSIVLLRGEGATRFIIDLRGNTGGFMEPAILMANEFLPAGAPIVSTRGRTPHSSQRVGADGSGGFQQEQLAVIIDEGSASASEIFAGAIQDNDRGMVVGRRSFGKGLVQNQIELSDSSAIRLTVARYYTPSGRCIQKAYTPGSPESYQMEIADRFLHGESFHADSVKLDTTQVFTTIGGRQVYGGGGIMPDIYVPNDTLGVTTYYIKVFNAGMLHRFAFAYADSHREELEAAGDFKQLLELLPQDDQLLVQFVGYAQQNAGIAPRWYYINISRDLIVRQLKSLIASDILGQAALFQVQNLTDPMVLRTVEAVTGEEDAVPEPLNIISEEDSDVTDN